MEVQLLVVMQMYGLNRNWFRPLLTKIKNTSSLSQDVFFYPIFAIYYDIHWACQLVAAVDDCPSRPPVRGIFSPYREFVV